MPEDLLLVPVIIHHGRFPLYDVSVRFADVDKSMNISNALQTYPIGNLPQGPSTTTAIKIPHYGKDINFNIFFSARNGLWIQILRMRWVGDGWATANKVIRGSEVVYREVSSNFPRQADGNIDWGEPGAQDAAPASQSVN
jgi:hypothetical protein